MEIVPLRYQPGADPRRARTTSAGAAPRRRGLAEVDDIVATFRREGQASAFAKVMAHIGMAADERPLVPPSQQMDPATADGARFLGHDLMATTRFVPDTAGLAASTTRVVVALAPRPGLRVR